MSGIPAYGTAEWLNRNSLRKYPLADNASAYGDSFVIPSDAIVDAQIYVPSECGDVWIGGVRDGHLVVSSDTGELCVSDETIRPDAVLRMRYTAVDGITAQAGVVVTGHAASALVSYGDIEFSKDQTLLAEDAISRTFLPAVTGFRLDDGSVVTGDVKFRGENGCDVATFIDFNGRNCLRISAIGRMASKNDTPDCVSEIAFTNENGVLNASRHETSEYTLCITTTGTRTGDDLDLSQDAICAVVKRKNSTDNVSHEDADTAPAANAAAVARAASEPDPVSGEYVTFTFVTHVKEGDAWVARIDATVRYAKGQVVTHVSGVNIPRSDTLGTGKTHIFSGYYNNPPAYVGAEQYDTIQIFDRNLTANNARIVADTDTTLYSSWSEVERQKGVISFAPGGYPSGYGTLHIYAPDATGYDNPVLVEPVEAPKTPAPVVSPEMIIASDGELLADMLAGGDSGGGVRLSIRGLDKIGST